MSSNPSFMAPQSVYMDFPILAVRRGSPDDVMDELDKLAREHPEKSEGQLAAEALAELDSLHEATNHYIDEQWKCAECWMIWPCASHKVIHPECDPTCTSHLIQDQ